MEQALQPFPLLSPKALGGRRLRPLSELLVVSATVCRASGWLPWETLTFQLQGWCASARALVCPLKM